jgi:hypothetical protein
MVLSRMIRPVSRSTTGAGLPRVATAFGSESVPESTICCADQVRPSSSDRRITRSISWESPHQVRLASAKASSVPVFVRTMAGIR